ncbi:hypothetical protein M8756_09315 [Lutimaribacter sp. EGI FJ00015]|uniref:Uncharacterized protein n=1 Tax=Lutimaribacter degradans TaxID=2945989 RepID=A0ACC5ZW83_9RHOB|nr:hypothetical protein [Lutimaribacter sp. EGI FJ00013]MCM2562350.1 hypothetical protein [Lutimaribacter sp. EGI FJ00013]MCO0613505.1 hypothetical protein [Lutimaribacter sp. EGI FJ00015]MCO0636479.1 hypothetical protein [Lutimaribacter sp. EGI FJ00014]
MTLADTQTTASDPRNDTKSEDALARKILLTVLLALVGWGLAIAQWGVPGLYIPALAMVPVMYVVLIMISRG